MVKKRNYTPEEYRKQRREYYAKNRDRILKRHREYYLKNKYKLRRYQKEYYQRPEVKERRKEYEQKPEVKERRKEYWKKYRKENIDKIKEQRKKYRRNNKEKINEWKKKNPEKARILNTRHMGRWVKKNRERYNILMKEAMFTRKYKKELFSFTSFKCVKCGKKAIILHHLSYDNLPRSKKTLKEYSKYVMPLCKDCHIKLHIKKRGHSI